MSDRSIGRALVVGLTLFVSASMACRDASKQEPSTEVAAQADASVVVAAPPPVPVDSASTASAVIAVADDVPVDAGPDAAKRRLRRIVGAGADAGAVEAPIAAPAEPVTGAAPRPAASGKRGATSMSNDHPFGETGGTAAPALKKTPLPGEDPWK